MLNHRVLKKIGKIDDYLKAHLFDFPSISHNLQLKKYEIEKVDFHEARLGTEEGYRLVVEVYNGSIGSEDPEMFECPLLCPQFYSSIDIEEVKEVNSLFHSLKALVVMPLEDKRFKEQYAIWRRRIEKYIFLSKELPNHVETVIKKLEVKKEDGQEYSGFDKIEMQKSWNRKLDIIMHPENLGFIEGEFTLDHSKELNKDSFNSFLKRIFKWDGESLETLEKVENQVYKGIGNGYNAKDIEDYNDKAFVFHERF